MKTTIYSDDWQAAAGRLADFYRQTGRTGLAWSPNWLTVLERSFGDRPYLIEATDERGVAVGWLPLSYVSSWLFGRFLVSLPYLNVGGVATQSSEAAAAIIDRACELADQLDVKFLELRGEQEWPHEKLTYTRTEKFHLRLPLPPSEDELWKSIGCKARNQVRKGEKAGLTIRWGTDSALIRDFYEIFCVNMRDLGTPVYSKTLFQNMADVFNSSGFCFGSADLCFNQKTGGVLPQVEFAVVYSAAGEPAAGAVLTYGLSDAPWVEVPSASCKRKFNRDCANMYLYWQLLTRSIDRKQVVFDFGRSSKDSPTFRFKTQWGALPHPSFWQYYLRGADPNCMRPDQGGYSLAVRIWQKLPVWLTKLIGPGIVRGIP